MPQYAYCVNRQSSKTGRILILDLKTCVKENKRMAVPGLVPSTIPVLELLILSQTLEVQTHWDFTFQSTAHAAFPDSLVATADTMSEPLPYWEGLRPGDSQPYFWSSCGEGCCPHPPAGACGGRSCPVEDSAQGSVQFLAKPRSHLHCGGQRHPAHAILWQA